MKRKFLVMAAVIISSQLQAQDSTFTKQLDELIVTATKFQQKQHTTGKLVTVIDQATLQRNAGKTITEIINYQTGIFINGANNNLGTNQDVYLRGAGTGNTLILIDGLPVGDPSQIDNSFDLNNIAVDQVERIEILKGAQSTLWGSDAVAGVINIITKKGGKNKISPSAMLSYGSYNTIRGNAGMGGSIEKFSYNVGYNFTNSKGFSSAYDSTGTKDFEKDKFAQHNIQANLGYKINNRLSAKGYYSFTKYKASIDAGPFQDDKDDVFNNKNSISNLELAYTVSKLQLHLSQSFVKAQRVYTDDSASVGGFAKYSKGHFNGNSNITELFGNITLAKRLSLVSGVQYISQKTSQDYLSISDYGVYKTALGDSAKTNTFSAYNSLVLTDVSGFNLEAGFRYNHHDIYGNNTTYTFNPSYNIDDNTKLFINISSAYKIPSLYQLYSEYGNKDLKPETSNNYEMGVQTFSNNKRNSFRIVGFKRDIKDLIIFYTDPATYASLYINRDEQHDYGFELESSIAIGKKGNWTNNFTYVDGEGMNNAVKVKNLYRRPNFTMNSLLTLQPTKGFTLMPSFRFIGTRLKGEYDLGPAQMPQYYTIDCYLGYQFTKQFNVFVDLRNITNQQYFDVVGYNSKKFNVMTGLSFSL
ncbi:TonB-dependent receptor [Ferruginibacter paludis]|uniref:TonB-dependent receptor plug domain-containing protein n=1 Tax=Ferruginibacter paludis TaxID=1310417 RepID=UPI0025B484D1|nr:TonB-dependent receptor [Ferruginibacter paludis]MDN3654093.1 TonB-dependent receptor [Ferruginibacter paludis]